MSDPARKSPHRLQRSPPVGDRYAEPDSRELPPHIDGKELTEVFGVLGQEHIEYLEASELIVKIGELAERLLEINAVVEA